MASDLTIHFMERAEVKAVEDLLDRTFGITISNSVDECFTDDPYRPIVFSALREGRVVGTLTCHLLNEKFGLVGRLAVEPSERGHGIGNALMAHAERFMGTEWMHGQPGFIGLIDETKKGNPESRFYEHMGYAPGDGIPSTPDSPYLEKSINGQPRIG